MIRKPDSDSRLPDALPGQGDASILLDFVIAHHAIRTQTVDLLADAVAQKTRGPEIGYQLLPDVGSYLKFSGKLFLLIHPEQKGETPVSLAIQEDTDGLIGWAHSFFEPLAVNLTLVHEKGYGEEVWNELGKIKEVRWIGSHNALDLVVGKKRIPPKTPRMGDGRSDAAMVASLPIKDIVYRKMANGYRGRDTIVDAKWPEGQQVYGLTGVHAEHRQQERSRELEQKPMTPDEIKSWIGHYKRFLEQTQQDLADLYVPNSFPNLKGYQKYRKINDLKESIAQDHGVIERLTQSLQDPSLSITPADLGIQIWI